MGYFHIILINNCVLHSCINLGMPQQLLYLFNWHSFVNSTCCHCPSKFMRMNLFHIQFSAKLTKPNLDTTDLQSFKRGIKCNKQRGISIITRFDIVLQMKLRLCVKIYSSLFFFFFLNNTLPFFEIDIANI